MGISDLYSEFKNVVIDDNNINFGLTINSVGYKSILQNDAIIQSNKIKDFRFQYKKGKISNEFKLIYITKGVGFVCFDDSQEVEISKGKVLLIQPNQKYTYYHLPDNDWKEYFIRFETDTFYYQMIRRFFPTENSIIDVGFNEELMKLFQRAIDVVQHGLKSSQVYLSGMLFHVLGLIISESKNKTLEKREEQRIEQAKIIMTENILNAISLQEIAAKIGVSYTLFRKNFKKYTNEAPAKYFHELRINKAKQLLIETTYSVKEISFMLQFTSNDYFSTSFKRATGQTPTDFRMTEISKNNVTKQPPNPLKGELRSVSQG